MPDKPKPSHFSRITLKPKNPLHTNAIWEFNCEEILYVMPYFTLINLGFIALNLFLFFSQSI